MVNREVYFCEDKKPPVKTTFIKRTRFYTLGKNLLFGFFSVSGQYLKSGRWRCDRHSYRKYRLRYLSRRYLHPHIQQNRYCSRYRLKLQFPHHHEWVSNRYPIF